MAVSLPEPSVEISILHYFRKLKDPRREGSCLHPLQDIIAIALCATIAGAQDWQETATFGEKRLDWLKRFLKLPNGIPSHDTFERVFERVNPQAFQKCFLNWVEAIREVLPIKHIAIDGKTLRSSGTDKLKALHLVSAWATEQHLSLGQVAVDDKSNEITAIPELLELLDIKGAIVTIDAMGCQRAIAQKITEQKGHYVLTVKDNQEHLLTDIQRSLSEASEQDFAGLEHDTYETRERGHGREEYRSYLVLHQTSGLRNAADWAKVTTIGMCYCERTVNGVTSDEIRYFIGSKKAKACTYAQALRNHWGIENSLHWQLDITFDEDDNRVSKRNGAVNLALLRRLTLSLLKAHPYKRSIAKKRFAAALDTKFLEEVLSGDGVLGNP
jgi:predicted transposase YbfD/YdcC